MLSVQVTTNIAIARSCFVELRQIRSVIGVHYNDMPYWHWSVPSWSLRLTATIAGMSEQLLSRLYTRATLC